MYGIFHGLNMLKPKPKPNNRYCVTCGRNRSVMPPTPDFCSHTARWLYIFTLFNVHLFGIYFAHLMTKPLGCAEIISRWIKDNFLKFNQCEERLGTLDPGMCPSFRSPGYSPDRGHFRVACPSVRGSHQRVPCGVKQPINFAGRPRRETTRKCTTGHELSN